MAMLLSIEELASVLFFVEKSNVRPLSIAKGDGDASALAASSSAWSSRRSRSISSPSSEETPALESPRSTWISPRRRPYGFVEQKSFETGGGLRRLLLFTAAHMDKGEGAAACAVLYGMSHDVDIEVHSSSPDHLVA
jgi:hypothetical protein